MRKSSDYRKHADECRALAKGMKQAEQREQLLAMAQTWERLADQRDITSRSEAEMALQEPQRPQQPKH